MSEIKCVGCGTDNPNDFDDPKATECVACEEERKEIEKKEALSDEGLDEVRCRGCGTKNVRDFEDPDDKKCVACAEETQQIIAKCRGTLEELGLEE